MTGGRKRHGKEGVGAGADRCAMLAHEADHRSLIATEAHRGGDQYGIEGARVREGPPIARIRDDHLMPLAAETIGHEARDLLRMAISRSVDQEYPHGLAPFVGMLAR